MADPVAFFDPVDETNERWEELGQHPDWAFTSPPFPPFLHILSGLANLVARHPQTTFIGAHVGCYAENLAWVGALLERCPNFFVDISARIGELGRQPYTARRFFLKYADRILFGSDMGPDLEAYRIIYRFLETDDEYFNYYPAPDPAAGALARPRPVPAGGCAGESLFPQRRASVFKPGIHDRQHPNPHFMKP